MAAAIQSNRLLPILGCVVAILVVLVLSRACGDGEEGEDLAMATVPEAPSPDLDSPTETIRTLSAELTEVSRRLEKLNEENQSLRERQQELETKQTKDDTPVPVANGTPDSGRLDALLERLDRLQEQVQNGTNGAASNGDADIEIPVGLGLEGDAPRDMDTWSQPQEQLVWVAPLNTEGTDEASGPSVPDTASVSMPDMPDLPAQPEPRYTVPRNSTLMGSTAMTALVGRIPRRGTVEDPMPFKVIVGRDNLAANGHTIPGVDSMIFSGTAVGDWTLGCVRGTLQSVTYVFEDGTIRSLMDPDGEADEDLGWISDARGVPCVAGKRITNAPAYLSQATGLATMQAAAEGAAAAQTTTIASGDAASSAITGRTGRFIAGRAISGGVEEIVQWLRERQEQHFDAVFAPAGVEVALHLDRELRIDYDPQGRKLSHATETETPAGSPRLD